VVYGGEEKEMKRKWWFPCKRERTEIVTERVKEMEINWFC